MEKTICQKLNFKQLTDFEKLVHKMSLKKNELCLVIVVDEIDMVMESGKRETKDLLNLLFSIAANKACSIALIGITNDVSSSAMEKQTSKVGFPLMCFVCFLQFIKQHQSVFHSCTVSLVENSCPLQKWNIVTFPVCDSAHVDSILDVWGIKSKLDCNVVEFISKKIACSTGNAREALDVACQLIEARKGSNKKVTMSDVAMLFKQKHSVSCPNRQTIAQRIDGLPTFTRAVLFVFVKAASRLQTVPLVLFKKLFRCSFEELIDHFEHLDIQEMLGNSADAGLVSLPPDHVSGFVSLNHDNVLLSFTKPSSDVMLCIDEHLKSSSIFSLGMKRLNKAIDVVLDAHTEGRIARVRR